MQNRLESLFDAPGPWAAGPAAVCYRAMPRRIIHVDMDEFFAAVEKLDNPALVGKPILVGGSPTGRGVVSTASYEARKFGCHSALPMARAVRLCPQAVVLPVRGDRYRAVSDEVFAVFEEFSPLIQPLSIDEAFLDVSGSERLFGPAEYIARQIKRRIRDEVGLTASVGLAPNMFLAKLASDLEKPDGLVVITDETVHDILDPLPISKLWGMGPASVKGFAALGVETIGQLRRMDPQLLTRHFGAMGEHFGRLANGLDERPVTPDGEAKSIGTETTFAVDVDQREELERVLLGQVEQVARRLRRHQLKARTLTLKIRYGDFTTLTRSTTWAEPTDATEELWQSAREVFGKWAGSHFQPLRLLGATASNLRGRAGTQLALFGDPGRAAHEAVDRAVDDITERFGKGAIGRGGTSPKPGNKGSGG